MCALKVSAAVGGNTAALEDENVTYLMNGQSIEALAFRVVSLCLIHAAKPVSSAVLRI